MTLLYPKTYGYWLAVVSFIVLFVLWLAVAITLPRQSVKCCATVYPNEVECETLLYAYQSPQQILNELKQRTEQSNLKLVNGRPSISGPCPGKGIHYGVRNGKIYVASIVGCPCCQDTILGPKLIWLFGIQ